MGLETIDFEIVTPKSNGTKLKESVLAIGVLKAKTANGRHQKFFVKSDDYVLDAMLIDSNLSIRLALCSSEDSINMVVSIADSILQTVDGYLVEKFTEKKFKSIDEKVSLALIEIFRARKEIFLDYVGNIENVAVGADELRTYLSQNNIKPRNPHKPADIRTIKNNLLKKISLITD